MPSWRSELLIWLIIATIAHGSDEQASLQASAAIGASNGGFTSWARVGGAASTTGRRLSAGAEALTAARLGERATFLDAHTLDLTLRGSEPTAPAAWAVLRAGASESWLEATPTIALVTPNARLGVGPSIRRADGDTIAGISLRAQSQALLAPQLGLRADGELNSWVGPTTPSAAGVAAVSARWAPSHAVDASIGLGARWLNGTKDDPTGGFHQDPNIGGRTHAQVRYWIMPTVGVGVEASASSIWANEWSQNFDAVFLVATRFTARSRVATPAFDGFVIRAPDATEVHIIGDFGEWQPFPLHQDPSGLWTLDLRLGPGTYEFVYIIDGEVVLPDDVPLRPDGFGGQNAVLVIR